MEFLKPVKLVKASKKEVLDSDFENENEAESKWNRPGRKNKFLVKTSQGYQAETSLNIIKKCKNKTTRAKISRAKTEAHIKQIKESIRFIQKEDSFNDLENQPCKKVETPKLIQVRPRIIKINMPSICQPSKQPIQNPRIICIHCAASYSSNPSIEWKCCENCPHSYWYCPKHISLLNEDSKCKFCQ